MNIININCKSLKIVETLISYIKKALKWGLLRYFYLEKQLFTSDN